MEGDRNMMVQDGPVKVKMDGESNEKDILIEGAIVGLVRKMVPGKLSRTHKVDPS